MTGLSEIRRHWRRVRDLWRDRLLISRAKLRRRTLDHVTFIGVTGSCGKTTSATLIATILSTVGKCRRGLEFNAAPDAAKSVLGIDAFTKFCVQELHAEAITQATAILKPQIGVVTTIGSDHYSVFRTLDAVAEAKGELIECLPPEGFAILNADDPYIRAMAARTKARVITFGRTPEADIRATEISGAWPKRLALNVLQSGESVSVETQLVGEHWVTAVLAAMACGTACGIDLGSSAKAIGTIEPNFSRYSVHVTPKDVTFVLDTVKAPFWTIEIAFAFVKRAGAVRKTIVFGTISDYPGAASRRYRRIGRQALEIADRVVFVGSHAGHIAKMITPALRERLFSFSTAYQASRFLAQNTLPGELVLIKASGSDHLDRLMLAQVGDVLCWRENCGKRKLCTMCHYLTKAQPLPRVA